MDRQVEIDLKKRARRALIWLCVALVHTGVARVSAEESENRQEAATAGPPVELCPLFGGSCCSNCSVALRHRWNIQLCLNPNELCCISEMCSQQAITSQRPADGAPSARTECEAEGGTCRPWYTSCGGTKVARRCGYLWQSCCNSSAASTPGPKEEAVGKLGDSAPAKGDGGDGNGGEAHGRQGSPRPMLSDGTSPHAAHAVEEDRDGTLDDWTSQGKSCGRAAHSVSDGETSDEWPWQAHIETGSGVAYCSGIIVDKLWILTSASCFNGMTHEHYSSHRVVVGRHDRNSTGSGYQTYSISAIIRHPLYGEIYRRSKGHRGDSFTHTDAEDAAKHAESNEEEDHSETAACGGSRGRQRTQHNQAMLRLSEAITFDEHVAPVCLPTRRTRFGERSCIVSGLLRHSSHRHAHRLAVDESGAESQRRRHSSNGRIQDAVACGRLLGDDSTDAQMCFERDEHEVVPQLRPGAFVTCLSDNGHHIAAAVSSGSFRHCRGNVVSAVAALPPSAFWIAGVMESSVDVSASKDQAKDQSSEILRKER